MIVPDEWNDWKPGYRSIWWRSPDRFPGMPPELPEPPAWIFFADKTRGEDYWANEAGQYFGFELHGQLDGLGHWRISASLIDPDDDELPLVAMTEAFPEFAQDGESAQLPTWEEVIRQARLRKTPVVHDSLLEMQFTIDDFKRSSDEEVRTTSSTGGQKGVKPQRYSLLPPEAMNAIATHFGKGAEKYDDHQWSKGYEWSKSFDAMQRHAWAFWGGEDNDAETGTPHMAAVGFHAMVLLTFMKTHPGHDDRPKK